jgi:hypothetical protein
MDTNLAVLYQKYLAYMADVRHGGEALRGKSRWLPLPDTLTFDQFEDMWRLAGQNPGLRERWLQRLTYGYEQERTPLGTSMGLNLLASGAIENARSRRA